MTWFKNYKKKECKTWIGKFFQQLFFNWFYKIITASALVLISVIAFNFVKEGGFWDNFFSVLYSIGLISLAIITITFIIYAWIINPIKGLIKYIKKSKNK